MVSLVKNMKVSRNTIKWIALGTMLIDHLAFCFLGTSKEYASLYLVMRSIGRISFPLFCFLLVQGFFTTRNIKKYFLRLFGFACLSEIPFDWMVSRVPFSGMKQNVLWTFCLSLLVLYGIHEMQDRILPAGFIICLGCLAAIFFRTDYSYLGIVFSVIFYGLRNRVGSQCLLLFLLMVAQGGISIFQILSLPFVFFYDSEKTSGHKFSYFFYWFYPVHLFVLSMLRDSLL